MFEALGRLGAAERPPYLLLTHSSHDGSELLQALAPEPPLYATTSFGDDLELFQAHWELLGRGDAPVLAPARSAVAGLELGDRLDVCDPQGRSRPRLPLRLAPRRAAAGGLGLDRTRRRGTARRRRAR